MLLCNHRLFWRGEADLFRRLEPLGVQATANFDKPDAGIRELRGRQLALTQRKEYWRGEANRMQRIICEEA